MLPYGSFSGRLAMTAIRAPWAAYIDRQHRYPTGLIGQIIGERMLRQHAPETAWSVRLLHVQPTDRILEIGFGAGRGLALALTQAHQGCVPALISPPTMIRAAAQRNRRRSSAASSSSYVAMSPRFRLGSSSFDKLFSVHTFYFWPDPRAVCTRLISILAHGGRPVSTFATARRLPNGDWNYWDIHHLAEHWSRSSISIPTSRPRSVWAELTRIQQCRNRDR